MAGVTHRLDDAVLFEAAIDGHASIVPELPPRPTSPNETGTVALTGTPIVSIGADEVYYGVNITDPTDASTFGWYYRAGWGAPLVHVSHEFVYDWTLNNAALLWSSSTIDAVNTVWADHLVNSGTIIAELRPYNGEMSPTPALVAQAVILLGSTISLGPDHPALVNSGTVQATATGANAIAIYTSSVRETIVNTGTIAAHATANDDPSISGGAQGIRMSNGGYVVNQAGGRIVAEGDSLAIAVYIGRGSHSAIDYGPDVNNAGLIEAVSTNPNVASIGIYAVNLGVTFNGFNWITIETLRIVNSGTIRADIAIYAPSDTGTFTSSSLTNPQTITNEATGVIEGDIQLFRGDDVLINRGRIVGTVELGEDNDRLDNSAGTIVGTVFGGTGHDTLIGGASADIFRGGRDNDTLSGGGGNDMLSGDFGHDLIEGGAGNDGMYGGVGNDILRAAGGDVALGGVGHDRIETGDYSFARIDGGTGFDSWAMAGGAREFSLSAIASSGRVGGIDLIATGGDKLIVVRAGNVTALSDDGTLWIDGVASDRIYLTGAWTNGGQVTHDGAVYTRFTLGAETVLILSGAQVTVGTAPPAAGGLDAIASGGAAPAAPVDWNDPHLEISDFRLTADLEISEDEVWSSPNGAPVFLFGPNSVEPDLINNGSILSEAGTGYYTAAIGSIPEDNSRWLGTPVIGTLTNNGLIRADALGAATHAYGVISGGRGLIVNNGAIHAFARDGDALAVATFGATGLDTPAMINNGDIYAFSADGYASGVSVFNAGLIENNGVIEADGGDGANALYFTAGMSMLINRGDIIAYSPNKSTYLAVAVAMFSDGVVVNEALGEIGGDIAFLLQGSQAGLFDITNAGTIHGAIILERFQGEPDMISTLRLTNSGTLNGSILVDDMQGYSSWTMFDGQSVFVNDIVINRGTIVGDIWLSGGDDIYDGRGGVLMGAIDGGSGNDRYFVDGQSNLIFEAANGGSDEVVSASSYYLYANIENLTLAGSGNLFGVGNDLANTITGNAGSNLLIGGAGNDVIRGGAGVDSLFGESGADQLFGDAGIDYLVGGIGNDTLDGGADADALYGEDGDDTLIGGTGFHTDIMVGGAGNDTLRGNSGLGDYDLMDGGAGNDSYYVDTPDDLTFEAVNGGTDTVYATINGAGYYLYANVENLVLGGNTPFGVGNALDNRITGSAAANWLLGGTGNDVLNGAGGNDVLFGEAGADIFVFQAGTGADAIGDFVAGTDRIDLSAFGFTSFAQVQAAIGENGGTSFIALGNGDMVVLNGVARSTLSAGDFILASAAQVPETGDVAVAVGTAQPWLVAGSGLQDRPLPVFDHF